MLLGDLLAERELSVVDPTPKTVTVRIGRPLVQSGGEWGCPHQIVGLGNEEVEVTYGADAIQALQLAFEHIRMTLKDAPEEVAWLGSKDLGSGLLRSFPLTLPRVFADKIDAAIDGVIAEWTEEIRSTRTSEEL